MIKNRRDLFAGLLLSAFGVFFLVYSLQYPIGTVNLMGPGFFPMCVSVVLTMFGIVISFKNIRAVCPVVYAVKEPIITITSIVLFVVLAQQVQWGLALTFLIVATSTAHNKFNIKNTVILVAIGLVMLTCFKYLLKVPLELWIY